MDSLDFTLKYLKTHSLRAILLAPRLKRPPTGQFPITTDASQILEHLGQGGNLGILGGEIAILDFDNMEYCNEMFWKIRALEPTVRTGSSKIHCYVKQVDIPPRMRWNDQSVGEVQRGPNQYVVAPPSIHPNGSRYVWLISDPEAPLQELPKEWLEYLNGEMTPEVPEWAKKYIGQGMPTLEPWSGPDASILLARAQAMPRSKPRSYGVKFQCPECRAEGHDNSYDNAIVFLDGHWACAYTGDQKHKNSIQIALNAFPEHSETARKEIQPLISDQDIVDIGAPVNDL